MDIYVEILPIVLAKEHRKIVVISFTLLRGCG